MTQFPSAGSHVASLLCQRSELSLKAKILIYMTFLRPILTYGALVWSSMTNSHLKKVEVLQNRTLQMITGALWFVRNSQLLAVLGVPSFKEYAQDLTRKTLGRAAVASNPLLSHLTKLDQDKPHPV